MAGTGDKLLTAAEIKEVTDTKVNISDVVNALNSTSTNKPLSAAQGKVLNDAKVDKTDTIAIEHGGTNATSASSARTNLDVYSKSEVDTAIAQSTESYEVETGGISDLSAVRTGNVVELVYNSTSGITVSAGGYAYVGYLPSSLRPLANLPVCGIAADDSGKTGIVSIQSSDGRIFIRSAVQATFLYFSLTYIIK